MTGLVAVLWVLLGAAELRRAIVDSLADERERESAGHAPSASAIRRSCEAPTVWGES